MKTLMRSPIRTLLTVVLLGVVTFAFFSRTAEYAIMLREMSSAARRLRGVGAVELEAAIRSPVNVPHVLADPRLDGNYVFGDASYYINRYRLLTQEQIEAVAGLPYVSSVSTRYMSAGVSGTYSRLQDGNDNQNANYFNYLRRLVIEATLSDVWYGVSSEEIYFMPQNFNRLVVEDVKYLTETPSNVPPLKMKSIFMDDVDRYLIYADPRIHSVWGIQQMNSIISPGDEAVYSDYVYDNEYLGALTPGSRYVFVLQASVYMIRQGIWLEEPSHLGDYFTDSWCEAARLIDGEPDGYLETQEFAELAELVAMTNTDLHTFDMVYTDDIGAIMRFAEGNMAIIDGRALTADDSENSAQVCVISRKLADEYGLEVGDTLAMTLGAELFEQYKGLGAMAVARERYSPASAPVTLEIAGIYKDVDTEMMQRDKPHWCYSVNTIFVPKSLLPIDESALTGHEFSPAEVSFTVDNVREIESFLDVTAPLLEEMGMTLIFDDAGWPEIVDAFNETGRLSIISISVFSVAVAAATLLIVYLYIGRKKKEYAIMRALGTTRRASDKALLLPLMVVAVVSILAGTGTAWVYTVGTIGKNNALSVLQEYSINTSIPAWVVAGCVLAELLLAMLLALVMLRHIGAKPPLALLQGGPRGHRGQEPDSKRREQWGGRVQKPVDIIEPLPPVRRDSYAASCIPGAPASVAEVSFNRTEHSATPDVGKGKSLTRRSEGAGGGSSVPYGFVLRYILRHARRAAGKSALSLLMAALLFGAVGQLTLMRQSYTDLVDSIRVTASFAGGLPLSAMHNINNNSFVSGSYYQSLMVKVGIGQKIENLVATNNLARYTGEEPEIAFISGYDESCLDTYGNIIIAGKSLMDRYRFEPGGAVEISNTYTLQRVQEQYLRRYRSEHPDDASANEEILETDHERIMEELKRYSDTYTIAGVFTTPSGMYDMMLFTPGALNAYWGLVVAEITLADNIRADEFREYGERIANSTGSISFVVDTSMLEGPRKTLRLLEALYPGTLAAALLIGGFLCCLMILQSSKEAAIMRIQGVPRRKTSLLLSLEQILFSIVGTALGICMMLIYKGSAIKVISAELALYAVLYFSIILASALACSALVTRRSVLDLLHTKE